MRRRCVLAWLSLTALLVLAAAELNDDDEDQLGDSKNGRFEGSGGAVDDNGELLLPSTIADKAGVKTTTKAQRIVTDENLVQEKEETATATAQSDSFSNTLTLVFSLGCVVLALVAFVVFLVSYFRDQRTKPTAV
uniref:Uncharacterized protein n=1 Tax=Plectus sambesii TaxID=2011161 RepID=A0A914XLX6_9BILA